MTWTTKEIESKKELNVLLDEAIWIIQNNIDQKRSPEDFSNDLKKTFVSLWKFASIDAIEMQKKNKKEKTNGQQQKEEKELEPGEDNNSTIIKLTGEDAKAFDEYDSKPPSPEEIKFLREAKAVYHKYSKKQSQQPQQEKEQKKEKKTKKKKEDPHFSATCECCG